MKRRFVVRPCDNCGTLDGPPRDRTWDVVDTSIDQVVATRDTRRAAREVAFAYNAAEGSSP